MIEIQQMIVKAKINGAFSETNQDIINTVNDLIKSYIANNTILNKMERSEVIEECIEVVFDKIAQNIRS